MSILIDNTDELLTVLKKLNIKVASVDELRQLLATINASYNPEAARQKTGKLIGVTVPSSMATAAGVTSFFLLEMGQGMMGQGMTSYHVGGLALIWGATALVSTAAVIASAIMTSLRRGNRIGPENTPEHQHRLVEGIATGITNELP
ncbi:MAG TPA: hypothetical protein VMG10_18480 [Gemmataceae bacterium]|nr:hypothetical protein [Gemmataceae bacterium]